MFALSFGTVSLAVACLLGATFLALIRGLRNPLNKVPGPWYARFSSLRLKWAVISGRRVHYVQALHEQYGPYVRISPTEIAVADPKAFAQIHSVKAGFEKSKWYQDFVMFERLTLFTMTDTKMHAGRRRMFARAFSKTQLRQHWQSAVREKVRLAVDRIRRDALEGTADVLKWWTFMASDVSAELMFGESFNTLETGQTTEYIRTLQAAMQGGGIGAELPVVKAILSRIPLQQFKEMFHGNAYLMQYGQRAVQNCKANANSRNIFATIIAEAEKGEKIDDTDVVLEATALTVAGSDTTAISLTYLVWAVLSNPEIQRRLEGEVASLPETFDDGQLEQLPFLNAVIEETLRLYGAAPGGLPRMVPAGGVEMNGVYLPEGTTVTTQSYSLHRDPAIFKNPLEFKPSRWLLFNDSQLSETAKTVFSPFGAGTHTCLGIHLAYMELRLATAEFFRRSPGAKVAATTTPASMEQMNYFLVQPVGHKCEITLC